MRAWRLKLLLAMGFLFVCAVLLLSIRAGLEAELARDTAASEAQYAVVAATPKVLGVQPERNLAQVYRPKYKPAPGPANGPATVVYRAPTNEPVVFITIDDGVTPDQAGLELMRQRRAVATLFLNNANIHRHYDYYKEWQKDSSSIQNHTDTHPRLPRVDAARQNAEVCGHVVVLERVFGKKPTLFRPPYGELEASQLGLIGSCGHKYVVQWSSYVEHGQIHYGKAGRMLPGEIVLLHFTPELAKDLAAVFAAADAQQLQIGRLEDWLF